MGVVVVCRAKSGGCVTTTALAIAACWPDPRPVTVVEADASGGTLAARAGLGPGPGLVEWAAAAGSSRPTGELLNQASRRFPGGGFVVVAAPVNTAEVASRATTQRGRYGGAPVRARAAVKVLADQPQLLHVDDAVLLLDVGQLAPDAPAWALAGRADSVLVCAPPSLDGLSAAFGLARALHADSPQAEAGRRAQVGFVVIGDGQYSPREVSAACPTPLWGLVAHDPRAAASLGAGRGLPPRSRLARSAAALAAQCAGTVASGPVPAPAASEPLTPHSMPPAEPPAHMACYDSSRALRGSGE